MHSARLLWEQRGGCSHYDTDAYLCWNENTVAQEEKAFSPLFYNFISLDTTRNILRHVYGRIHLGCDTTLCNRKCGFQGRHIGGQRRRTHVEQRRITAARGMGKRQDRQDTRPHPCQFGCRILPSKSGKSDKSPHGRRGPGVGTNA